MKKSIKKTDHILSMVIIEIFEYIQDLFENPLTPMQKELILIGGLTALTQLLIKEPLGECGLSVLYSDDKHNTEIREIIKEIPEMYKVLQLENGN